MRPLSRREGENRDSQIKAFCFFFSKKKALLALALADLIEAQRGRFMLFLPVFMAAGILIYFALPAEPPLTGALAVCAAMLALTAAIWRAPVARAGAICLAASATGFALACLATALAPPWADLPRHAVLVSGRIAVLDVLPEGRRITIAAPSLDGAPALARSVRVRLRGTDAAVLAPGDLVRVRALLKPPSPPDYPGGWDTQRDAFFAGLAGYGFAIGPAERLSQAGNTPWSALRSTIAGRVRAGLPGPAGAIAATLLTGLGTAIPPGDRAAFQDAGLAHLLAVAGLHIGIVMGLAFAATRFGLALWERAALYWPTRQIAALAALAAGAGYLALTGAHVPIIRSFAMAAVVTLGVLTSRRAVSLRSLALACLVLMVLSPASVVGVSFQMSFAAVLTLIAGYEMARPALARLGPGTRWRRPVLHTAGLVLTSLLAGTASLPFAIYHFGSATLYYVPANMLAVPLTALWVLPWGLAALALMPVGLERLALAPMGWGIDGLLAIAHNVASWPGAVVEMRQSPAWGLVLVSAGLVWAGLWRGWMRVGGVLPLALGLAAPLLVRPPDVLITPQAGLIAVHLPSGTLGRDAPGRLAVRTCGAWPCVRVRCWPAARWAAEGGVYASRMPLRCAWPGCGSGAPCCGGGLRGRAGRRRHTLGGCVHRGQGAGPFSRGARRCGSLGIRRWRAGSGRPAVSGAPAPGPTPIMCQSCQWPRRNSSLDRPPQQARKFFGCSSRKEPPVLPLASGANSPYSQAARKPARCPAHPAVRPG